MKYNEKHSFKWIKIFADAYARMLEVDKKLAAGDKEGYAQGCMQILKGDFSDEKKIYPGTTIWIPYFIAECGEMELRHKMLFENAPVDIDEKQVNTITKELQAFYLEDAVSVVAKYGFISEDKLRAVFAKGVDKQKPTTKWLEDLTALRKESEQAIEEYTFNMDVLHKWMEWAIGLIYYYNYNLNRQGLICVQILEQTDDEGLADLIEKTKDEFGWAVSRVFFTDTFFKLGMPQDELYATGRYSMFCDQTLSGSELECDEENIEKVRQSLIENCQLYSNFKTVAEHMGVDFRKLCVGICEYCADHGQKNQNIFTSPDQKPVYIKARSLGAGDECCEFISKYYEDEEDDQMERFMEAQEMIQG